MSGTTVFPGSYVVGFYRGVLRHGGSPWYRCRHEHETPQQARECAKEGKLRIGQLPPNAPLPSDWAMFRTETP